MELLLRVLVGIAEVTFEVDGDFENLTVGFAVGFTGETIDLIGELIEVLIFSTLVLKIGFTFNGFFQADSDSRVILLCSSRFCGSSAWFSALEGPFVNFESFG